MEEVFFCPNCMAKISAGIRNAQYAAGTSMFRTPLISCR